jgi:hypothetical protein
MMHRKVAWVDAFVMTVFLLVPSHGVAQSPPTMPERGVSLPVPIIAAPTPQAQTPSDSPMDAITPTAIPLDPWRLEMLTKDLADLATMLSGRWDNELQTFFEPELGVAPASRHDRLHAFVRPLDASAFGPNAFYVEYRSGGEAGKIVRQRVWTLMLDKQLAGVRLSSFAPNDAKPLEGAWRNLAPLSLLKASDFTAVSGCDIIWRRRGDGFYGETQLAQCKVVTTGTPPRILTVSEQHDLSPNIWEVRDRGIDENGARVFGSPDHSATRFRRITPFVCWVGARKGQETVTASDLMVHDQGGMASATLAGASPNSVSVRLRNVEWPIGQNRPSLTLYLMTGSDTNAKAYAWSEPDAGRIALDVGGTQASCTRDERALWR